MLMPLLALVFGLGMLIWSSERFVDGAVGTAHHLKLPPFVIGTVIVGVGTSAPEFLVSGLAAWQGQPGLAIGNASGSNIANIGLILGVALLLSPMLVATGILRREMALLVAVTLLSRWLIADGLIDRLDALLLVLPLAAYLILTVWQARRRPASVDPVVEAPDTSSVPALGRSMFWLAVGLVLLVVSSRALVWGASAIATALGVSDLVIGLTIVAIGTSLPELASSISAVRRKAYDLVLGNVLGSNLFNTLGVVGVAGLIAPIGIEPGVAARDWPVMMTLTLLLAVFAMRFGQRPARLNRFEGGALLLAFVAYTTWLLVGALGGG